MVELLLVLYMQRPSLHLSVTTCLLTCSSLTNCQGAERWNARGVLLTSVGKRQVVERHLPVVIKVISQDFNIEEIS